MFYPFYERNVSKYGYVKVYTRVRCEDKFCTRGVKRDRMRVEEFGISDEFLKRF